MSSRAYFQLTSVHRFGLRGKLAAAALAIVILSGRPETRLRTAGQADVGPVLAASGSQLTLDGKPQFLLILSYFDGLRTMEHAPARVRSDFKYIKDTIRAHGIRVLVNWCDYRETAATTCGVAPDTLVHA